MAGRELRKTTARGTLAVRALFPRVAHLALLQLRGRGIEHGRNHHHHAGQHQESRASTRASTAEVRQTARNQSRPAPTCLGTTNKSVLRPAVQEIDPSGHAQSATPAHCTAPHLRPGGHFWHVSVFGLMTYSVSAVHS
eukprot:3766711-Rhodomonas_salina.2